MVQENEMDLCLGSLQIKKKNDLLLVKLRKISGLMSVDLGHQVI